MKYQVIFKEVISWVIELSAKDETTAEEKAWVKWEKDREKFFDQFEGDIEVECKEAE